jgi:hypothetical protein
VNGSAIVSHYLHPPRCRRAATSYRQSATLRCRMRHSIASHPEDTQEDNPGRNSSQKFSKEKISTCRGDHGATHSRVAVSSALNAAGFPASLTIWNDRKWRRMTGTGFARAGYATEGFGPQQISRSDLLVLCAYPPCTLCPSSTLYRKYKATEIQKDISHRLYSFWDQPMRKDPRRHQSSSGRTCGLVMAGSRKPGIIQLHQTAYENNENSSSDVTSNGLHD